MITISNSIFLTLQVASVFLVAVAMALSLAHALEFPGKLRLNRETYLAIQPVYYPGFTVGGAVGEGLGMPVTLILLLVTPAGSAAFGWTLAGFIALILMHGAYWVFTHPVNKFWLKDQQLKGGGARFFGFHLVKPQDEGEYNEEDLWKRYRNRWEYSHVLRAVLSAAALIALIIAVALSAPTQ